jgi:transcriptional repressor NrdR
MSDEQVTALAGEIEEEARLAGPEVTTQEIGIAVLDRLRAVDHVSYLRFASVYKGFEDLTDFEREVGLLAKATPPKSH